MVENSVKSLQSLPVAASNKETLSEEQMIDIAPLDLSARLGTGKFLTKYF